MTRFVRRFFVALAALGVLGISGIAELQAQEPRLEARTVEELREAADPPPFCELRDGEVEGHPRFGAEWCLRQGHAERIPALGLTADRLGEQALEPFCRPGGGGHPEHGWEWCRQKQDGGEFLLYDDAGDGSDLPRFCRTGEGHPDHGMEWCRLSQEERERLQPREE